MIRKLNSLCIKAWVSFTGLLGDVKKDEKGMEVVQVVLLILVGVLIIAAIYAALTGLLKTWWNQITGVKISPANFE